MDQAFFQNDKLAGIITTQASYAVLSGIVSALILAFQKEMTIDELRFSKFYPYFNLPNDLLIKTAQARVDR